MVHIPSRKNESDAHLKWDERMIQKSAPSRCSRSHVINSQLMFDLDKLKTAPAKWRYFFRKAWFRKKCLKILPYTELTPPLDESWKMVYCIEAGRGLITKFLMNDALCEFQDLLCWRNSMIKILHDPPVGGALNACYKLVALVPVKYETTTFKAHRLCYICLKES